MIILPHTKRIEKIKFDWSETKSTHQFRPLTLEVEDVEWLIKQAETLNEITDSWVNTTTNKRIEGGIIMNALEASQRINVLCDKLEGISFMYEQFQDGKVLEESLNVALEEEAGILEELKTLQDKLEAINIDR